MKARVLWNRTWWAVLVISTMMVSSGISDGVNGARSGGAGVAEAAPSQQASPQEVARPPLGGPLADLIPDPTVPPSIREKNPYRRMKFFHDQRAFPNRDIPPNALLRARQQARDRIRTGALPVTPQGKTTAQAVAAESLWSSVGPQPIGDGFFGWSMGVAPNSGRVPAIAVKDANTAYVGAAVGGVWKTTDGGIQWTPLTDDQVSLAVGAIALDPTNPDTVYVGLGEQNNCGSLCYYGYGILKSTDGGSTWTHINDPIFTRSSIGRIAVDPNNRNIVYAASTNGIAQSTDGGLSWTSTWMDSWGWATDVVIDANTNPSTVYFAEGAWWGSSDNGIYQTTADKLNTRANWTKLTGFPSNETGRIRLAITRTNPAVIYAVAQRTSDSGILGVWKSSNAGATWTATGSNPSPGGCNAWYNLNIGVYPTDPNNVYVLCTELFKTTDGGANWALISNGYSGPPYKIHVDQHAFAFIPGNPNGIYVGNDGGVYRSLDAGASFQNLNQTLSITQFWRGAAHPTSATSAFGGTQDNGSLSYENSGTWFRAYGGDGGYAAIDYNNPQNVYASSQGLGLIRSTSGPRGSWFSATNGIDSNEPREFIAPFVIDPSNPQTLYAGTTRLYRSTNGTASWGAMSSPFSRSISAIGVGRSSSSIVYAGIGDGVVQVTTNGGASWADRSSGLPNRYVTSIAVDPVSSSTAYISLSGFGTNHVYKSTDDGVNWRSASGTLPDAPVNAIIVDPADRLLLYVATDVGVYKSSDGGDSWSSLNSGLPNSVVHDLVLNRAGTHLFAFTAGRGVFVASRAAPPLTVDDIWTNDGGDDWAVRKTTFNTGDSIRYVGAVNNPTGGTVTAHFVWDVRGPGGSIAGWSGDLDTSTGTVWWGLPGTIPGPAGRPNTASRPSVLPAGATAGAGEPSGIIPASTPAGTYTYSLSVTYSSQTSTRSTTFTVAPTQFALTVSKAGAGTGTVTSNPAGINCGADCSEDYLSGTNVTLAASPATGSTFAGWSGACMNATGDCTVAMDAAKSVTATFTTTSGSPILTVSKAGTGTGTVTSIPAGIACGSDCTQNYASGTTVKLTAAAVSGSYFAGWSGACTNTTGQCVITMDAAKSVTATFNTGYLLTVKKIGTGSGAVTSADGRIDCGADCTEGYTSGSAVTLSASATAGSSFYRWTGGCTGTAPTCSVTMSAAKTVTAEFRRPVLTLKKSGTGSGTVTSVDGGINCGADCTEPYALGAEVSLSATAAAGSQFTGWSGGGCTGAAPTCSVTVDQSKTVTATFKPIADLAGRNVDSPDPVRVGETITYTVTVTNNGPSPASDVKVTDALTGLTFIAASYTNGATTGGCTTSGTTTTTVTCTLGTLASGASATVVIQASPKAAAAARSNSASASASLIYDPVSTNNKGTTTTRVNR